MKSYDKTTIERPNEIRYHFACFSICIHTKLRSISHKYQFLSPLYWEKPVFATEHLSNFRFFLDKKKAANCETWSGRKRNCFKKFKTAESKRRKHNYRCCSFSLKTYISINTHRPKVRIEVGILLSICGFHTSQTKKTASLSASRTKKKKHWFWRCHKTKISSHLQ